MIDRRSSLLLFLAGMLLAFAFASPLAAQMIVRVGPSGGPGGQPFADEPGSARNARVTQVRVWSGKAVDSVQMSWMTADGERSGGRHGGTGGRMQVFDVDEGDAIVKMTGRSGDLVDSIQFQTAKGKTSPVFGGGGGADFVYMAPEGFEIAGFFGRRGAGLDAIGVVIRPRK